MEAIKRMVSRFFPRMNIFMLQLWGQVLIGVLIDKCIIFIAAARFFASIFHFGPLAFMVPPEREPQVLFRFLPRQLIFKLAGPLARAF